MRVLLYGRRRAWSNSSAWHAVLGKTLRGRVGIIAGLGYRALLGRYEADDQHQHAEGGVGADGDSEVE